MDTINSFKSAFVAFIGRPNCGKSTLLNTIIGENLSIVTPMPQTTQKIMRGIYNGEGYQLVFVDTPGIHRGRHTLNKAMFRQSTKLFADAGIDIICYIVDLSRASGREEDEIAQMVADTKTAACILFNKTDLCETVENTIASFFSKYPKLSSLPSKAISAVSPSAKESFLKVIEPLLPFGPKYFPGDELTDSSLRFFAAEYIRKQIIELTHQEVPHAAYVEIQDYKEYADRHIVTANIHVETDGQKGIVIGKKGAIINQIKKRAEQELAKLTGTPVMIVYHVTVTPKWRDDKRFLGEMGFEVK